MTGRRLLTVPDSRTLVLVERLCNCLITCSHDSGHPAARYGQLIRALSSRLLLQTGSVSPSSTGGLASAHRAYCHLGRAKQSRVSRADGRVFGKLFERPQDHVGGHSIQSTDKCLFGEPFKPFVREFLIRRPNKFSRRPQRSSTTDGRRHKPDSRWSVEPPVGYGGGTERVSALALGGAGCANHSVRFQL